MSDRYLATPLRRALEKTVRQAREVAERGASDAVRRLGVAESKPPTHLDDDAKALRRRLRAHARVLGDTFDRATERQETGHLVEAAAYAHWHRMLFARFVAERNLLRHPEHGVPVSLDDCRELAAEEGLRDAWAVAERYAAAMLPAAFRPDDPVLALAFAPEHAQALQRLVISLDPAVFEAEDSLGWTYQFWRAAEKDAVNRAGGKIGADELPAVTQLFTEPYMVRFLLHNTLGAWWAGKVLAARPDLAAHAPDEAALRQACALPGYAFDMLRFVKEDERWRPAAGTFTGWPKSAREITVLDPCCGSGHFLTEVLAILTGLRRVEEVLSPADAVVAVLRDNLFGLEIDERCVQIAAFAVALGAWRLGGWQALPLPHIAWVGAPPPLPKGEFVALANGNLDLARALAVLHDLFVRAPLLGSLIEPTGGDLIDPVRVARIEDMIEPLIERARAAEPERAEGAIAARGMADAVAILARRYTLQATNVPFLGRGKQDPNLADYIARVFPHAKADLATAMLSRMVQLAAKSGTVASVTPQSWLFLGSYKKLRERLLQDTTLNVIGALGPRAFETISGEVVNTALIGLSNCAPTTAMAFAGLDANDARDPRAKAAVLRIGDTLVLKQGEQRANPDATVALTPTSSLPRLSKFATFHNGICTGDFERFGRKFWEVTRLGGEAWTLQQTTVDDTAMFGGYENAILWEGGEGDLYDFVMERLEGNTAAWIRGTDIWGQTGVLVSAMRDLKVSRYSGDAFDDNSVAVLAQNPGHFPAIWAFMSDSVFSIDVRKFTRALKVRGDMLKVPFDLHHWQKVAAERYPDGLPEPHSDDPTQWLFHGHPANSEIGTAVHVALAHLAGFRWPAETDRDMRLSTEARDWIAKAAKLPASDADGLLCLPSIAGERPLAERLRAYLAVVFGADWSDGYERRLIAEADERFEKKPTKDGSLEAWLRDRSFRQHCALFHDRPFLWHIWDGLKDGFSVLVHYHRFDTAALRKLTFTLLGDWIARAKAERNDLRAEKARELQQKLERILEGEKPYDIFVRWKPLARQPLGWDPDLDDGVRMNIRPFVTGGILRDTPKIKWAKDRGTDVASAPWYQVFEGERINDHHTTLTEKRAAREAVERRAVGA